MTSITPGGILIFRKGKIMKFKVYMMKSFKKWLKKQDVEDGTLINAVREVNKGLVDVDYGNCLYKKRIPLSGRGKRSGARTLIAFKRDEKFFFLHGFAKNEKDNISDKEKLAFFEYVDLYMSFNDEQLNEAIKCGELTEIDYEE